MEAFPCLGLAMAAAKAGGTAGAVLSGANEVAVELFLQDRIGFSDISPAGGAGPGRRTQTAGPNLAQILEADRLARQSVIAHAGG